MQFSGYCIFTGSKGFSNQTVDLLMNNHNLTLDCNDTYHHKNYSAISYTWKRGSEIILSNTHYIVNNSLLTIVNLETADAGHYQCTIYDSVETQIITINIIQVIIKGVFVYNYIYICVCVCTCVCVCVWLCQNHPYEHKK